MPYARILHVYTLVLIDTLACMLKIFVTCLYECQAISDMIVLMSEYPMMGKYSLVGFHTLIMYDIIDGRYVQIGNVSCLQLFLL